MYISCPGPSCTSDRTMFFTWLFVATVGVVAQACPPCDTTACPQEVERECSLGAVPDPCVCCPLGICALGEGELCYNASIFKHMPARRRLGVCAQNMICILRTDLGPSDGLEAVCRCAEERVACGSDNQTYESTCKMYRAEDNKRVTLQHWGPCQQEPKIESGPEGANRFVGQPLSLTCEAKGFPVPSISWQFVGSKSSAVLLPGDDQSVTVQSRGGPEKLMISSWLQITQSRLTDSGIYSCVASNQRGSISAVAHVQIKQSK